MRLNKGIKITAILFVAVYALYVVGAAVFLNMGLLQTVADMKNDDQTYVKLKGGFSPFPGFLYVSSGRVFISDQNVSIGIDVTGIRARFTLRPFLKTPVHIHVSRLYIKDAKVDIGMKTLEESVAYQAKYVKPEDLDLKKRAEKVKEFETSHVVLEFPSIQIDNISEINSSLGLFKGGVSLTGGFTIQPKVQVEVFPTTLKFFSGEIPDQFSSVQGEAKAKIDRFRMIDAPGNAVFPYFTANLRLDLGVRSLKFLDMTLRKLPGYSFEGTDTKLSVRADMEKGHLLKGTSVSTQPSQLSIRTPGVTATGFGHIKWEVDSDQTSVVNAQLEKVKVTHNADAYMAGTLKRMKLGVKLYGNELVDAFHGLVVSLNLNGLRWNVESRDKNPNLQYKGMVTGEGTLRGFSGEVPKSVKSNQGKPSDLKLKIEDLNLKTSFLSQIKGAGNINVFAHSVDLAENAIQFPKVMATLDLDLGKYGKVQTQASFKNLEHRLYPEESWKGQLEWKMDKTTPFVDALVDQDKMSGLLGMVARVNHLIIKMDCELGKEDSWLRFNEVSSDGLWKAYGTLTNQEEGMKGLFETKVLNLPIGIRIRPEKTDIKFLPSSEWYDESQSEVPRSVE